MKDRVGNGNPDKEALDALLADILSLTSRVSAFTVSLSPEERLRTTKFRPGGERIVELIAGLAEQHKLALPNISVVGMRADLQLSQQLRPVAQQAQSLADTLSDTVLEAESECWWAMGAFYTTLVRMADTDPKLAEALRPAIDFFATGRRKKVQDK